MAPVTALRRSLALALVVAAFPAGAHANGLSNCLVTEDADGYTRAGTCSGEAAAGRIDFLVTPAPETVGRWTIRITNLGGRTLMVTRCETSPSSGVSCSSDGGRGDWSRSFSSGAVLGSQQATLDSKIGLRFVFSVAPSRGERAFSGAAVFTAAGTPRA